jgi:hypothetical protein
LTNESKRRKYGVRNKILYCDKLTNECKRRKYGVNIKFSICSVIFVVLEICAYVGGWGRGVGPSLVSSPFEVKPSSAHIKPKKL